ncbi:hypothetical protein OAA28_00660 [bacterium]|nr:hypothetical protein [bacterium]
MSPNTGFYGHRQENRKEGFYQSKAQPILGKEKISSGSAIPPV